MSTSASDELKNSSKTDDSSSSSPSSSSISTEAINISRLRRALLYVPGNDQRKVDKVKAIVNSVDSIVLDCEDGVAVNMKEEARQRILSTLSSLTTDGSDDVLLDRLSVRVNSVDSGLAADDLRVVLSGPVLPKTLLLPKVDRKTDIDSFLESFQNALQNRPPPLPPSSKATNDEGAGSSKKQSKKAAQEQLQSLEPIELIIYVESARGLLDLKDICEHFLEMAEFTKCRLAGIVFGSDDFCANIGEFPLMLLMAPLVRTTARRCCSPVSRWSWWQRPFELQAIDAVYINYRDLEGLQRQASEGAAMGFTGKQAIHPSQPGIIQAAFAPSDERIKWAVGLVAAFEAAQAAGKGAFVYGGQMIDMPLLRQAYNVLRTARQIGKA
ncbi:hypothetical protein TYRP_001839 [Tyrophagus putrescentiae]|nr:hypothetical protein TYRP_001839 [Tyrophagus putrescentiae]